MCFIKYVVRGKRPLWAHNLSLTLGYYEFLHSQQIGQNKGSAAIGKMKIQNSSYFNSAVLGDHYFICI